MKCKYIICCIALFFNALTLYSQKKENVDEDKSKDSLGIAETKQMLQELKEKLDTLIKRTDIEDIGHFKFYETSPAVYSKQEYAKLQAEFNSNNKLFKKDLEQIKKGKSSSYTKPLINVFKPLTTPNSKIEISKVEFSTEEGQIETIRVTTKDNRIFENRRSIPLDGYDLFSTKIFLYDVRNNDQFLKPNDFLFYLPKAGQYYVPSDGTFNLDSSKTEAPVTLNVDLNSYLDIRLYTDFLALFNKV